MTEAQILQDTMAALAPLQPRILFWRNNTGAFKVDERFVRFGQNGSPDIIGCAGGRFFGIECKTAKGTLSSSQKLWSERLAVAGGLYLVCRGDVEFIKHKIQELIEG